MRVHVGRINGVRLLQVVCAMMPVANQHDDSVDISDKVFNCTIKFWLKSNDEEIFVPTF
jgi:hypothetical protein